jgi:hypothetical protein
MAITWEIIEQPIGNPYLHKTDENGVVSIVPMDEANSDYQAYLNKDTLPSNSAIKEVPAKK